MFRLEITSLDEFIKFVNLIRGEDLDAEKLKSLTDALNKDADALIEAEKKQEKLK